jgi:hypothetical protein
VQKGAGTATDIVGAVGVTVRPGDE